MFFLAIFISYLSLVSAIQEELKSYLCPSGEEKLKTPFCCISFQKRVGYFLDSAKARQPCKLHDDGCISCTDDKKITSKFCSFSDFVAAGYIPFKFGYHKHLTELFDMSELVQTKPNYFQTVTKFLEKKNPELLKILLPSMTESELWNLILLPNFQVELAITIGFNGEKIRIPGVLSSDGGVLLRVSSEMGFNSGRILFDGIEIAPLFQEKSLSDQIKKIILRSDQNFIDIGYRLVDNLALAEFRNPAPFTTYVEPKNVRGHKGPDLTSRRWSIAASGLSPSNNLYIRGRSNSVSVSSQRARSMSPPAVSPERLAKLQHNRADTEQQKFSSQAKPKTLANIQWPRPPPLALEELLKQKEEREKQRSASLLSSTTRRKSTTSLESKTKVPPTMSTSFRKPIEPSTETRDTLSVPPVKEKPEVLMKSNLNSSSSVLKIDISDTQTSEEPKDLASAVEDQPHHFSIVLDPPSSPSITLLERSDKARAKSEVKISDLSDVVVEKKVIDTGSSLQFSQPQESPRTFIIAKTFKVVLFPSDISFMDLGKLLSPSLSKELVWFHQGKDQKHPFFVDPSVKIKKSQSLKDRNSFLEQNTLLFSANGKTDFKPFDLFTFSSEPPSTQDLLKLADYLIRKKSEPIKHLIVQDSHPFTRSIEFLVLLGTLNITRKYDENRTRDVMETVHKSLGIEYKIDDLENKYKPILESYFKEKLKRVTQHIKDNWIF